MTQYEMTLSVQVYDRKNKEYSTITFKVDSIEQGQEIVKRMKKNGARVLQASVSAFVIVE